MAEFAFGLTKTAVEGTVNRVKSAIDVEEKLKVQVRNDLVFITGEFQMMQSFLSVANKERAENEVVRTWVRQIRDLAFDAEDCVELVVGLNVKSGWSWLWRVVPTCMAPPRPIDDAVAEIQRLKARVVDVSQRNTRYNLIGDSSSDSKTTTRVTTVSKSPAPDLMHNTEPSSSAFHILREVWEDAGKMRHDMGDLKKLICKKGNDLEVISLWGSQGSAADLGTTSIVRKAYNDPEICEKFKIRAWIKLIHPFNLDEFLKSLLTQLYPTSPHHQANLEPCSQTTEEFHLIKTELMQQVSQQRYLVIVEQLSTVAEWDTIGMYLQDSKNGSRIIVTTQQLGLALSCTREPYQVSELRKFYDGESLCAFFKEDDSGVLDGETNQQPVPLSIKKPPSSVDKVEKWGVELETKQHSPSLPYSKNWSSNEKGNSDLRGNVLSSRKEKARGWIKKFKLIGHHSEWERLCHHLQHDGPGVISAWGIVGVGKSTLVRSIYCTNMIGLEQEHLDTKFINIGCLQEVTKYSWVDVPQPFNLIELFRRLLIDFHSDDLEAKEIVAVGLMEGQDPIEECRKFLHQDKCFVVIDGLRSIHDWDLIKPTFSSEAIKGCILVITNEERVARHCVDDENRVINIKGLEADMAINLFTKQIWGGNQLTSDEVELSRRTMTKCGGLSTVITAIAKYCLKPYESKKHMLESINADFMGMMLTEPIFLSLRGLFSWMQSYFDNCPDFLKPCIFYMSVFPLGHVIRRRRLLRRWIAEGYSRDTPGSIAEENGEKFFDDLVKLSIIQQWQQSHSPSKAVVCQVNGFFREYIISRQMEDNLVFALDGSCRLNSIGAGQHLTISSCWDRNKIVFDSMDLSRLRSLTVFGEWRSFFISTDVDMGLLRVLDLENTSGVRDGDIEQIGKLRRLKFLSLRGCKGITRLPRSLGVLKQLQTLDVKGTSIVMLPCAIIRLQKLQYIRAGTTVPSAMEGLPTEEAATPAVEEAVQTTTPWSSRARDSVVSCSWLSNKFSCRRRRSGVKVPAAAGIGKLTALHTLGVVSITSGGKAILKEVKKLTQLHKLGVSGINRENWHDLWSVISGYAHLESLSLRLDDNEEKQQQEDMCCLDDISKPPHTLKSLKLYGGNVQVSVVWMKQLGESLIKAHFQDLELIISTQEDIDSLIELPCKDTFRHLCLKPIKDGELHYDSLVAPWPREVFEAPDLKIDCGSYKLVIVFGGRMPEYVEVLVVHCSTTKSSLEVYGLENLFHLKEVWLKGSYSDALKQHLQQRLDELYNLRLQEKHDYGYKFPRRRVVLKLAEQPRRS